MHLRRKPKTASTFKLIPWRRNRISVPKKAMDGTATRARKQLRNSLSRRKQSSCQDVFSPLRNLFPQSRIPKSQLPESVFLPYLPTCWEVNSPVILSSQFQSLENVPGVSGCTCIRFFRKGKSNNCFYIHGIYYLFTEFIYS